jgi:beta-lactamase regulating signal transducer with metallopeptidase domain
MMALLVEAALRSLLLGLAAGAAIRFLRVRNPQVETTIWIVVLAASLAMPLLMQMTLVHLPNGLVTLPHALLPQSLLATALAPTANALVVATHEHVALHEHAVAAAHWWVGLWPDMWSGALLVYGTVAAVLLVYGTVAAVLLLRLATGLLVTWRIVRDARPIRADWTRGADVRVTARILSPVTFGRVILVPVSFIGWPAAKRRAVMGHELSHIEHRDFAVQVLSQFHSALFWFSPLAWWLQVRLAALAETTSDEAAILRVGDRVSYAEILLDIASGSRSLPAGIAMARPAQLNERIEHILTQAAPAVTLTPRRRLLLAAAVLPIAALAGGTSWHPTTTARFVIPAIPAIPAIEPIESGSVAVYPVVIQSAGRSVINAGGADLQRLLAMRDKVGGEAVLFLRDGRLYRITDRDLVDQAAELFEPPEDYADQIRDIAEQEREIGEQQADIGQQQAEIGQRMSEGAQRYSQAVSQQSADMAKASSGDRDRLVAGRDEARRDFDQEMAALGREQGDLGRQEGRLGAQQGHLNAQRGRLDADRSRVARQADEKLVRLLDRAVARGTAVAVGISCDNSSGCAG